MITINISIVTGKLEYFHTQSFEPGKNGSYRKAKIFLTRVKAMYNTAKRFTEIKRGRYGRYKEILKIEGRMPGEMKVQIVPGESLFPYNESEIWALRTKYNIK